MKIKNESRYYMSTVEHTQNTALSTKQTLLIIGYNRLDDGFRACANYLEKDYRVLFFPLLYYENQNLDASGDLIRYIKGQPLLHESESYKMIPNDQPIDIVFLWYFNYFAKTWAKFDEFMTVKTALSADVCLIAYSWDPMIIKSEMNPIRIQLLSECHAFLTGDSQEIYYLKHHGLKHVFYSPSGFDCDLTQPHELTDSEYSCDVSIVCTNLYDHVGSFPEDYVRLNRKKLIDLIYENRQEIKFHIYGPEFLRTLYPDCYRGYVRYVDCPKVFSNSRINLCIHAVSYVSQGSELYFSERLPQILGSRGLLYCETEYNYLLDPAVNYVLADVADPLKQIRSILANYDDYQSYRDQGYNLALKYFTWSEMRRKLKVITDTFFAHRKQQLYEQQKFQKNKERLKKQQDTQPSLNRQQKKRCYRKDRLAINKLEPETLKSKSSFHVNSYKPTALNIKYPDRNWTI
jgi:hypothetical protein